MSIWRTFIKVREHRAGCKESTQHNTLEQLTEEKQKEVIKGKEQRDIKISLIL